MTPTWAATGIIALCAGLFIAFLIFAYRWMDAVKDNHLAHIQAAGEKTAEHTLELWMGMRAHDEHEGTHHKEVMDAMKRDEDARRREFDELKTLIRTHGL